VSSAVRSSSTVSLTPLIEQCGRIDHRTPRVNHARRFRDGLDGLRKTGKVRQQINNNPSNTTKSNRATTPLSRAGHCKSVHVFTHVFYKVSFRQEHLHGENYNLPDGTYSVLHIPTRPCSSHDDAESRGRGTRHSRTYRFETSRRVLRPT